jgi:MFS transporter, DHA3 family, multidrug efflux protein
VSFLVTSVISGLLVAAGEMFYVLLLGMVVLVLSVVHLAFVRVDERHEGAPETQSSSIDQHADVSKVDLRGTLAVVRGVLGLLALIGFTLHNTTFTSSKSRTGLSLSPVLATERRAGSIAADGVPHRPDHPADTGAERAPEQAPGLH